MEWVAMPFGMCNAPTTFPQMIIDIMGDFSSLLSISTTYVFTTESTCVLFSNVSKRRA
jgi:hypothetical protein